MKTELKKLSAKIDLIESRLSHLELLRSLTERPNEEKKTKRLIENG